MTCRECVQLPPYVNGVDYIIDKQSLETTNDLLVQFSDLENGRRKEIGTLNKDRGDIFSEFYTEKFKENFLRYLNEVLF